MCVCTYINYVLCIWHLFSVSVFSHRCSCGISLLQWQLYCLNLPWWIHHYFEFSIIFFPPLLFQFKERKIILIRMWHSLAEVNGYWCSCSYIYFLLTAFAIIITKKVHRRKKRIYNNIINTPTRSLRPFFPASISERFSSWHSWMKGSH